MLDHLPPWPVVSVVACVLLLIAVSWGVLAKRNDELEAGIDETLERRIADHENGGNA